MADHTVTDSPSVLLREAARIMRERAQAATPGPWRALCDGYGDTSAGTREDQRRDLLWVRHGDTNAGDVVSTYGQWSERSEADVLHIASWHPAVALAVADWLDDVANRHHEIEWQECGADGIPDLDRPMPSFCAHCTDAEYVAAVEYGDTIDLAADVKHWPCEDYSAALSVARVYLGSTDE